MVQHDGPAAEVVVERGQEVEAGRLLGKAGADGAVNIHAPRPGRVAAIGRVDTADAPDVPAVQLDVASEGNDRQAATSSQTFPVGPITIENLAARADDAGIIASHRPARPLGAFLRQATAAKVDTFIINGMPAEPALTARTEILTEHLDAVLAAALWIRTALGTVKRTCLVLDAADRQLRARCRAAVAGKPIRTLGLRNRYPQSDPVLLASTILGREAPPGRSTFAVATLVLDAETLALLWTAATHRRPVVEQVVSVAGPPLARPGCYSIPIGTSFADVLRHVGLRRSAGQVIEGGLMTGRAVPDLAHVVTRRTAAILVLSRDEARTPRPGPCVRCGWCHEDCPVGLDPLALLDIMHRNQPLQARGLHPRACIECGVCSYVCPAELPLAAAAADLKRLVPPEP